MTVIAIRLTFWCSGRCRRASADPWGKGKAFRCRAEHCGEEVSLYIRAKIGFCGCVTAIDDDEVDRVGDLDPQ